MKTPRTAGKVGNLSKLLIYAPIALEIVSLLRQNQKKKQGKYVKARKRDKALDFLLNQARRKVGQKTHKRGWF